MNPFIQLHAIKQVNPRPFRYPDLARDLAIAFASLHVHHSVSADESYAHLCAALRALGRKTGRGWTDSLFGALSGYCFQPYWEDNLQCQLDPNCIPELQDLANAYLESEDSRA